MKNFTKAPKSTFISIVLFIVFSVMKIAGKVDGAEYIPLATLAIGGMLTDPLKERDKVKEDDCE